MTAYEFDGALSNVDLANAGSIGDALEVFEREWNVCFENVVLRHESWDYGTYGDRLTFKRRGGRDRHAPFRLRRLVKR